MCFVGQIQVGGPNVTLYGDASSVYAQTLELNPDYNPMDFPEYRERNAARLARGADTLVKRDWVSALYLDLKYT